MNVIYYFIIIIYKIGPLLGHDVACSCGKQGNISKISENIGKAEDHQFPYLVTLWYNGIFMCQGSLISYKDVITSGHCVTEWNRERGCSQRLKKERMMVIVNEVSTNDQYDGQAIFEVENIRVHPYFNHTTNEYSFGLIRIKNYKAIHSIKTVGIVCLLTDTNANFIYKKMIGAGWRAPSKKKNGTFTEQRVEYALLYGHPENACKEKIPTYVKTSSMCAINNAHKACFGYRGGPAIAEVNGRHSLVGIINFNNATCFLAVYSKIISVIGWIIIHSEAGECQDYAEYPNEVYSNNYPSGLKSYICCTGANLEISIQLAFAIFASALFASIV